MRCDITTSPGVWTVFQRRVDATVDFNRTWAEYREGFGDLAGSFWLGLEKLHQLAGPGKGATLRVDIKHLDLPGEIRYAEYSIFEISDEASGYKLRIGGYTGNAEDSLSFHNDLKFTTKDHDNDPARNYNCAVKYSGGWWYKTCFSANLNAQFPSENKVDPNTMSWYELKKAHGSINFSEMKIKF